MSRTLPRYPVYVPSKGRAAACSTGRFLVADGVPFYLVVEPQEADDYAREFGRERLLVLPFSNRGSVVPARNWIKAHSIALGAERHWQLDDNMSRVRRFWKGKRLPCAAGPALAVVEDFADRYTNVGVAGLNYTMFCVGPMPPFTLNVHVYSCSLVLNSMPFEWRGRYNEDTDLCLQALSAGYCTVLVNAFMVDKKWTMVVKGGNTTALYQGDGRLKMARALERMWPHVVSVDRRFRRPQHVVRDNWAGFDTPLIRRDDLDWDATLQQVAPEIKSAEIRAMLDEQQAGGSDA